MTDWPLSWEEPAAALLLAVGVVAGVVAAGGLWVARRKRRLPTPDVAVRDMNGLRDAVLSVGPDGVVWEGNAAAAALFGWPSRSDGRPPHGTRLTALFAVDDPDVGARQPIDRMMVMAWLGDETADRSAVPYGTRLVAQRGAVPKPVSVSVVRRTADGVLLVVSDDSDKQEIARLRAQEERLSLGNTMARVGTWDWNIDSGDLHWSGETYRLFGREPGTVRPTRALFHSMLNSEEARRVQAAEQRCIASQAPYDEVFQIVWEDGTQLWLRETGDVVRDGTGRPYRFIGVVRDVTEEKKQEAEILHQAYHDPLTGLSNRAWFRIVMGDALARARRTGARVGVGFVDLDGFKPVNDCYGHAVGDRVLIAVGERLQSAVRATDAVARLGGDEFALLLENLADVEGAQAVAGKALAAISEPIEVAGVEHRVSGSLGVILATLPVSPQGRLFKSMEKDVDRLLDRADQAMYEAKRAGAGSIRIYEDPAPAEGSSGDGPVVADCPGIS